MSWSFSHLLHACYINLLALTILIFGKKLLRFSLCNISSILFPPFLLGPDILPSTLFLYILSLWCLLMWETNSFVQHAFLDMAQEDKGFWTVWWQAVSKFKLILIPWILVRYCHSQIVELCYIFKALITLYYNFILCSNDETWTYMGTPHCSKNVISF
jgi:hypothetical protein